MEPSEDRLVGLCLVEASVSQGAAEPCLEVASVAQRAADQLEGAAYREAASAAPRPSNDPAVEVDWGASLWEVAVPSLVGAYLEIQEVLWGLAFHPEDQAAQDLASDDQEASLVRGLGGLEDLEDLASLDHRPCHREDPASVDFAQTASTLRS